MTSHILAIDQGTTSSRAIIFDDNFHIVSVAQQELTQFFPKSGWVEHDGEEILRSTLATCHKALDQSGLQGSDIDAIGITNQRETTIVWDKQTGKPIHRAIVWQDRRTSAFCASLDSWGYGPMITNKTGLLPDSYFSATKIKWLLDNVGDARKKADRGQLLFGTVDTFLLWHLTGKKIHATDATNASRTMLYNIHENCWDHELLEILDIPRAMLPEVQDSSADFGTTTPELFGAPIRIGGVAGDQQAALVGQACFAPGMVKSTYGTGCFIVLNTGEQPVTSDNRLLTTIGYRLRGKTTYALEGSIFVAGSAVQWMRDAMGLIESAEQTGELAGQADPDQDVYLVPAFTGLGAPHWDGNARGAIFGITRATGPAELSRAALESVCYQTRDLLDAMQKDWGKMGDTVLRVDGGMVASNYTMQFLADILNAPVDRPVILETTALGAAYLAGLHIGMVPSLEKISASWQLNRQFRPSLDDAVRLRKYNGWKEAVRRTLSTG
ncbi:glycerol kinase GlpK [Desulforhopalus singaporensis]|uniref:Glycerol kinase n=1 Tax=Desulforhopalus singaporensis TaxID=91360 RepID=A0A1H0RJ98_9BACT|nr:glycerol kinase GlpK [Desulforhopalus singaporensis]SDP29594.1 glycerol kinase [Desulforhopalus singaporensis]